MRPLEKLMLIRIAEDCDREAICSVDFAGMAEFCCCAPQECRDALQELERAGHLLMMTLGDAGSDVALPWWTAGHREPDSPLFTPRAGFPADLRALMLECQRGLCWYCGGNLAATGKTPHLEHQVPISRGGPDNIQNLVLACATCNITKHDKTVPEFRQYVIERDRRPKTYRFHGESL
ncbi:MAG: HNH endonuclease [Gaiellaceae bacterium]